MKLVLFLLLAINGPSDKTVYQWRGPDRSGNYPDKNLLKTWPAAGPEELWSIESIGNGYGSPVFAGDRFYITGEIDSTCYLFSFNQQGKEQWRTSMGREWMRSCPGSRSAPTVAGELVYAGSGMGNLFCINRNTGKIIWSKHLEEDFRGVLPLHGHSESPLIDGNKIFWTAGGKVHNVVALDRFTGKLVWTNKGFGETSAYNQPKLIEHPSGHILVTFSAYHMMGFDANTGKMLWSQEQDNYPLEKRGPGYGDTHCNTVLYENGTIWYVEGDGNCTVKLEISADGKSIKEGWRNKDFDSYMGGVVRIGDYMYCGGTVKPQLISINAGTGMLRDSLRIGTGAIISADGMLYYYTQKGEMMLLSCNNGNIEKVSSFRISKGTKEHFSHPVINKGVLYIRHGNALIAYNIKA
jgi:outer membrane protein assembly factor BamB